MLDDAGYEDTDDDGIREVPGEAAPGFEFAIGLLGMFALVPIVSKLKRKK